MLIRVMTGTVLGLFVFASAIHAADDPRAALVDDSVVFEEVDGVVAVEAEHFQKQTHADKRAWYRFTPDVQPDVKPDGDPPHLEGASGGAYLEILPDTRRRHGDRLIRGENFSNEPGRLAVLHYRVHFNTPGRYYVWARIYSTNTEDNGLHVGLDGEWPASGQRMQWTTKNRWVWGSKQRTERKHTGEPGKLYLDITRAGHHVISFAMREDGTEFDKWLMTTEKRDRIEGAGPATRVRRGELPDGYGVGPDQAAGGKTPASPDAPDPLMDVENDLLSLHYDHAPDRDDGHSAAADRTILQTLYGQPWLKQHVLPVSGAYGENRNHFREDSDAVMDAVWKPITNWIAADRDWDQAVKAVAVRWMKVLRAGGDVWVKEGGQSDLTADVVRHLRDAWSDLDTTKRIHVVQHSNWNENKTTDDDLAYVKEHTDYIRISDANRYLNDRDGDRAFESAALKHREFGPGWKAAFEYYDPRHRLDFSDTGELLHIVGLGEMNIDAVRRRFLE